MKPDSKDETPSEEILDAGAEFTNWPIPDVTEPIPDDISNLFGRKTSAKSPVEDVQPHLPPTLAEIEDIRQQAEQEGLEQGKEEGLKSGLETGRLEGLKQGHEEGLKQGIEQGYSEGLEQAKVLIDKFESLIDQFEKPLSLLDTEIEQELVSLTIKLTRAVIGHEIKTHPEHILAALRQGVDSLPLKEQGISIRLHPDDHSLVQELYSVNQLEKNRWILEADPSLLVGDCVIQSQRSSVDMRLEQRITSVLQGMNHHLEHLNHLSQQQDQELPSYHRSDAPSETVTESVNSSDSTAEETPQPVSAEENIEQPNEQTGQEGPQHEQSSKPTAE